MVAGTVRKLVDRLKELHSSGDELSRRTVGVAMLWAFKSAHDMMQAYIAEIIPVVFMVSDRRTGGTR